MNELIETKRARNREYMRIWSLTHREEARKRAREQYTKIKLDEDRWNKRVATRRAYEKENHDLIQIRHKKYQVNYRKKNPQARIAHNLRTRLWSALNKQKAHKKGTTQELIGCTIPELIKYLENQFKVGMSWSRRGDIHIDHKIPLISFDLTNPVNQRKAFHYTNLQPMWAVDNMKKGKKI